jgi:hypothetical protein
MTIERRPRRVTKSRLTRGQAMVEYSIVSHAILLIGATGMLGIGQYLRLFDAIDRYLDSLYFVVTAGAV